MILPVEITQEAWCKTHCSHSGLVPVEDSQASHSACLVSTGFFVNATIQNYILLPARATSLKVIPPRIIVGGWAIGCNPGQASENGCVVCRRLATERRTDQVNGRHRATIIRVSGL